MSIVAEYSIEAGSGGVVNGGVSGFNCVDRAIVGGGGGCLGKKI